MSREGAGGDGEPGGSSVVCSILESDPARARAAIESAPVACGWIELRAERLGDADALQLVSRYGNRLIFTLRPVNEAAPGERSEEARARLFGRALETGAAWIDVEWGRPVAALAEARHADRVILSHHAAHADARRLGESYAAMRGSRAARLKIVAEAARPSDVLAVRPLLERAARERRALACFAQGRGGASSRLLAPSWGSWATYGAATPGRESAPGQFTARDLLEIYEVDAIGPSTRLHAPLGGSLSGSPPPAMHAAAYRAAGIDARYFPMELALSARRDAPAEPGEPGEPDELDGLFEPGGLADQLGLGGFAVTMPFKRRVASLCRPADGLAAAAGAVNTVVRARSGWLAYNTDGTAALDLLGRRIDLDGAAVAVLGAGGTARSIAAALAPAGARVTLFGRDSARVSCAADAVGAQPASWRELSGAHWQVLVNATPLGSRGERILPVEGLRGRVVLDAVYGPEPTPLVQDARSRGLGVISGFELLVAQAALQFQRHVGQAAERAVMSAAGTQWLSRRRP